MFKYLIQKDPQYAFVVSKAVAKKATDRNRLRRQGYMALHSHRLKPVAGIFFFKKSLKKTSISDIKENISSVLNKINT